MTASQASTSEVGARPPTTGASETQPTVGRPAFSFGPSSSYAQGTSAFGSYPAPGHQVPTGASGPAVVSSAAPPWQRASVAPPGVGQYPWSSSNQASFPAVTNHGDTTTWNSSFASIDAQPTSQGETFSWGPGGPATSGFSGAFPGPNQVPGYGMMSFRPFIAYDAVDPFDPSLPLDKRRLRLSHNEGTKVWVQQLPATLRHSWTALSDKTFLWRLNAAAVKANVDYQSPSGCRRHLNQFLKHLRDRELQVSLQGRLYSTVDGLEETLRQVEEMERGLRRRPANDVQFGRHKPSAVSSGVAARGTSGAKAPAAYLSVAPQTDDTAPTRPLQWDDDVDSDYGYQYDDEDDDDEVHSLKQEDVYRAESPWGTNPRGDRPRDRSRGPDPRSRGTSGASSLQSPCAECGRPGHVRDDCWRLMKCDRCAGKHPTNLCRRRKCEACGQLHPAGQWEVLATLKRLAQGGKLQGVPDDVLQSLRQDVAPALNN
ncbi:hypothetical protein PHYSODRAFT_337208 [Phytophthora sojae]|uniref:CCHC-type domain-containing protein n=1 Tax=Phytophthora sojae (strain P6497) TaxID=1094619 RepID=G4ZZN9_PHYSP|nr:hypothetical protein PHYSODRAFT_337208 [Phytophthora sojae]EGZ10385.1 hypothetical protein PHYSODRAFT_337208 [Phytophthora sojae]|eukprot:XP_009533130.1 hypothetical protein PHYSODRAFT_337208 [Phytophthora sojae]